ncbi:MAG: hypothetical protein AVDCRST_MAG75-2465 [uncultured Propionibacteriaceae bacterium]|uniref:Uncharacterized protein n=1 Tax=uncultured Propionibacteriaceae bacterium TaxID=257457 RepID=A0A6J4PBI2_9ACTN|nr:MAG: hypothetical protein AVDCRST_MAG75-2465 [uncultured Propionibacteriaceae bacterium]
MLPVVRAVLGLASFFVVGSALMLLVVKPGTGEFVITVFSLAIGLALGAVAIPLIRMNGRHHH